MKASRVVFEGKNLLVINNGSRMLAFELFNGHVFVLPGDFTPHFKEETVTEVIEIQNSFEEQVNMATRVQAGLVRQIERNKK